MEAEVAVHSGILAFEHLHDWKFFLKRYENSQDSMLAVRAFILFLSVMAFNDFDLEILKQELNNPITLISAKKYLKIGGFEVFH
jgi:hypothetical protein